MSKIVLYKGERLGSGGFGVVYRATERDSGRSVALKKSRVSLRIKRTLLQHEASVLKFLSGHPGIPEVFAYGRVEHFELLSLQLLGRSLGDIVDENGPLSVMSVLEITDQLLSVLHHMNTRGIVHRDIKPDNILVKCHGSWKVCLVDFGLAYPCPKTNQSQLQCSGHSEQRYGIFGTLPYASINAHRRLDLTYRDDLESLSYTLLFLLRGYLPWSHYVGHGTVLSRLRQVYEQKNSLCGERLALGLPSEFGMLVDYARSLSTRDKPDFLHWQNQFERLLSVAVEQNIYMAKLSKASSEPPKQPKSPVQVGQIVLAQVLSAVTVEGYSAQAGHEDSFIHDSALEKDEWSAPPRPAVVIHVEWDNIAHLYKVVVVAICRQPGKVVGGNILSAPIIGPSGTGSEAAISIHPDWPLDDSYCYVFQRRVTFYCLPSQVPIPVIWEVDGANVTLLRRKLAPPRDPFSFARELRSPDSDVRHGARMRRGSVRVFAQLSALMQEQIENADKLTASINWYHDRAWFDECVRVCRRCDLDDGVWWTGAAFGGERVKNAHEEPGPSDSYWGNDYEDWENRQHERDISLTLSTDSGSPGDKQEVQAILQNLDEIAAIEDAVH